MAESVYKIIELVGTSPTSWEKAAAAAVKQASKSLRDLRVAEISKLDMALEEGKPVAYRARVKVSFKFATEGGSTSSAAAAEASKPAAKKAAKKAAPKKAAKKAPRKKRKKKA